MSSSFPPMLLLLQNYSRPKHFAQRSGPSDQLSRSLLTRPSLQVTYDLNQMNPANLVGLRDTLMTALQQYGTTGPRTVVVQLCLALACLALQLPQWENAVESTIATLGQNPATVPALLEFLLLLPEELNNNTRIPITVRTILTQVNQIS